ncbi:MAG: clan AA aspartic protease [Microcystis sp.]|jgi:clan AA aspartic protease|uniref:clan AA aspartic protease n=1 Tax=Microcystis sp. TaxID=1127 RepID=UPI00391944F1
MMMQGYVNQNYEAMLSLVVRNGDKLKSITAVIDTGFTGFLSLPIATIRELELSWSYRDRATLGDGSEVLFDIYDGMVIWGGQYREIEINAAETEPLIGMSLLRGYRLQVDTVQGGLITISELPIAV